LRSVTAALYGDIDLEDPAEVDGVASGASGLLLELEHTGIVDHLDELTRERDGLKGHADTIQHERDALRGHAETIQRERDALEEHSQSIQRERDALRGHVDNLERIITKTHARWTYRVLGGVKGLLFPKRS
jgi:FtsZ-binding cell division protein ZapB